MPRENNPLFSVIVPAYNVEQYLPQCVESVLTQDYQDFELILVDDGSIDRTGEICDQYAKKSAKNPKKSQPQPSIISQIDKKVNTTAPKTTPIRIKVIHQPNAGLSAARNSGVAQASGEYLIFLDGDDYLEPDALRAIQENLEPELDVLRYQAQEVFTDGKILKHREAGFTTTSGVKAFQNLASYYYTENAWLYAYRTAFFRENHFRYAEGCIAEDFGLTPLIIARANTVKAIPNICYDYRQREGSIMHDTTKIARRTRDSLCQLQQILPIIATIPQTAPILHYLVVSFLTGAAGLSRDEFLQAYHEAKAAGMLRYIHPASLKALPRALALRHFPKLFYQIYHH